MGLSIAQIEAQIAAQQAALIDLAGQTALTRLRLRDALAGVRQDALQDLTNSARWLQRIQGLSVPALAAGWDSELWERFTGDPSQALPLHYIRIGAVVEAGLFSNETPLHDVPTLIPFLEAQGAVVIQCDEKSRGTARSLLQSLLLRAAVAMPAETRFTLIDPLGIGAAFPFRASLPRVRSSGRSVSEELGEVVDDIRRINHAVVGHASRLLSLSADQRAGEPFEIVAATDFPKAFVKDPRAVEQLLKIANSGARAGRHLILEAFMDQSLPHDFDWSQFENAIFIDCRQLASADSAPLSAQQQNLLQAANKAGQETQVGDWDTIVKPKNWFTESAARCVKTRVGERLNVWLGDDDKGKPSAHCMLAGQTGSGKSFLLHVLITGLAASYSPDELRFVLVDGKQGVEFEIYKDLPHAEVVCLRTSPATARSVLEDFVAEMDDRYEAFLRVGAVKLEDYRNKTGNAMPRKILVVDEYQQLLDGDPEHGGSLLSKVLEKGRAAGTHLILGSQTFNVQGMPASALTHVHLRISLSLAQDYVQSLHVFGTEGKRLIRELGPSGEVVINDESGRDGANARGAVARFANRSGGDALQETCAAIRDAALARGPASPAIVLSGRDAAVLSDNTWVRQWRKGPPSPSELQAVARQSVRKGGWGVENWSAADQPLALWLGRKFDVRGHALATLRRGPAQNILVLGSQTDLRCMMLALALCALPSVVDPSALEVLIIDGLGSGLPGAGLLRMAGLHLELRGAQVKFASRGSEGTALQSFVAHHAQAASENVTRLLVISEPDYLSELQTGIDSFAPPTQGPAAALREALARGPQAGLHVIMSATGVTALASVLSPSREGRYFNHRVVQQMNEDESMTLFASLAAARIADQAGHPHAALVVDMVRGVRAGVLFASYAADANVNRAQDEQALQDALGRIHSAVS